MLRGVPAGFEDEEVVLNNGGYFFDSDDDEIHASGGKIKVVPHITCGAALNGDDFEVNLSDDMCRWLDGFKDNWAMFKRSNSMNHNLKTVLLSDPQPMLLALKLFASCPESKNHKNKNINAFIMETICDLQREQPTIAATCDDNARMVAFNFVKTCGTPSLYKSVMDAYGLRKICHLLVPKLKDLIAKGNYKDAAHWAILLNVQQFFDLFEIIFPLILQDKVFLVEEYLYGDKDQQVSTVQFLDTLLDKQKTVCEHCDPILQKYKYKDIRLDILQYRPMSKLVARLAKKFNLAEHMTPTLNFSRTCSYISFLFHKYEDGGMNCQAFRELIYDAVKTRELQLYMVKRIAQYNQEEAIYWVNYFKVPHSECPQHLQDKLQEILSDEAAGESAANSSPNDREGFLTLQLPDDCVFLVDTRQQFIDMVKALQGHHQIAFDSEWKPVMCAANDVALLQLATYKNVYLIDCLSTNLTTDLWKMLGQQVFNNMEILKVGFAIRQDLCMLQKSLPLQLDTQSSLGYLDLRKLWQRLKGLQITAFPHGDGTHGESLCALAEISFGMKLDKSNQCSNWSNRPLRQDQKLYAALDAHCLLLIYDVIADMLRERYLDIQDFVDEISLASGTGKRTRARSHQKETSTVPDEAGASGGGKPEIEEIAQKVLCDSMLNALSKELRKLGIDCVEVTKQDTNFYVELAKKEQRVVLSQGDRFKEFSRELHVKQCFELPSTLSVTQQVLKVIDRLNIKVHQRHLFTRCVQCNSNEFILATSEELQVMSFGEVLPDQNVVGVNEKIDPYKKTFQLYTLSDHIKMTKKTYKGKPIKFGRLKRHILCSNETFYICDNCGVCTWNATHPLHSSIMERVEVEEPQ